LLCGAARSHAALTPDCGEGAVCGLRLPGLVHLEGWLATEPVGPGSTRRFDLKVVAIERGGQWAVAHGTVRVSARSFAEGWQAGDCVRARVWLRRPRNFANPGHFDYEGHLRRQGIFVTGGIYTSRSTTGCARATEAPTRYVHEARRRIGTAIDAALPRETGSLLRGLLIGDRSGISKERRARYARAGAGHVLAISGLHLSIVGTATFATVRAVLGQSQALLIRGLPPRVAAVAAVPAVIGYAVVAGGRSPTLRAVLMLMVFLAAVAAGRRSRIWHGLATAAILMAAARPGIVFDPGFAFSFIAVASIVVGLARVGISGRPDSSRADLASASPSDDTGGLGRYANPVRRARQWIRTSVVVSCGAAIGTAPLSAYYFNLISLVGPITNLLVLPLFGAALVLGFFGATLALTGADGRLAFVVAGHVISWAEAIVSHAARLPGAAASVFTPTGVEVALAYTLLAAAVTRRSRRLALVVVMGAVLIDAAYWVRERYARPDLRITFLDVGQGDAAVVEFPGSAVLVIDGGGFPGSTLDAGEAIVARYLRSRKIGRVDFIAMSHADTDHAGGLSHLISNFRPREFWWNGRDGDGNTLARVRQALRRHGVAVRTLSRASPLRRVGPVTIRALHPAPERASSLAANDASLTLRLQWGRTSVLFAGDLEREGERQLIRDGKGDLSSTFLKVPHHGSRSSSTGAFLDAVRPEIAVMSLGRRNRYGFPHPEVERRYRVRGVCVLRTDEAGAVVLRATPDGLRVTPACPAGVDMVRETIKVRS
jgi:competence protein ComEC